MSQSKFLQDNVNVRQFVDTSELEIASLIRESKAKNTNRSTDSALRKLRLYLQHRELPTIEDVDNADLPDILLKFYTDIRTQKTGENFQTSSFKVIRAGLNRYFKCERSLDIVSDERFMKANLVFDSVQVKAKKMGKGVTRSTPHISQEDMVKLGNYFNVNHVQKPNPKVLQHTVQFFIMYFFCRRGQENLYSMTKNHFKLIVDYDGTEYVVQTLDEMDKNHGVNETELANQGKMYADPSKFSFLFRHYKIFKFLENTRKKDKCQL